MTTRQREVRLGISLAFCRFLIAFRDLNFTERATIYALVIFKVNGDAGCIVRGGDWIYL